MKDFAIFILSHNRANKLDTLNLLKESNYNGDWFVVISTDNNEIDEYRSIIPHNNLLIFDKKPYHVTQCFQGKIFVLTPLYMQEIS